MKNLIYSLFIIPFFFNCNSENKDIISKETKEELLVVEKELNIFPDTVREKNEELNYYIYILYPEYSNYDQDGLRKMSRGFLYSKRTEFLKFIKDFDDSSTHSLKGEYIVRYQDKNLLSMELLSEWAVPGASRIIYDQRPLNWDLNKKKFLKEIEYFIQKDSIEVFKNIVDKKEKEKCEFRPKRKDYTFTFSEEEGIFLNPIQELNPPECYNLSVIIPWEELEDILTDEGKLFLNQQQ